MTEKEIMGLMPYGPAFHFVDGFDHLDEDRVVGHYHFKAESAFYRHHFVGRPVTPGVLLTECMAQIALVGHGLFLLAAQGHEVQGDRLQVAFAENHTQFLQAVPPDSRVEVRAEKQYFRMNKLKTKAEMFLADGSLVARATLAGMIKAGI